ncbi:MAG TPA: type II secretion system F family protein [Actinomycetales bacterium]|nr:type II secretion system F family protein [Actinomycetales bacterium]
MPVALLVAALVLVAVLLGWPSAGARLSRLSAESGGGGVPPGQRGVGLALMPVNDQAGAADVLSAELGRDVDAPLVLDLVAAALAAGAPPHRAMETVGIAVQGTMGRSLCEVAARLRLGSDWDSAWRDAPRRLEPLRRTLQLASRTGAPASALLRDAAEDLRRRRSREAQAAAGRLGVRMVLPLGLCSLPAFVAWAVVPVVISLAGRVLDG